MEKSKASGFPFGLLELDSAGTVVSFSPARDERVSVPAPDDVVGQSFFEEVAPVEELLSFKARFLGFMAFGDSVVRYSFSFPYEDIVVAGEILLARLADRAEVGGRRRALVRLAPAA